MKQKESFISSSYGTTRPSKQPWRQSLLRNFFLALLCIIVQGAWAQNYRKWDGTSYGASVDYSTNPATIHIEWPYQLYWLFLYWDKYTWQHDYDDSYSDHSAYKCNECNIVLDHDLDMTWGNWPPIPELTKTFDGNGHHIKLRIGDTSTNYQGLFKKIASGGVVKNLHVDCDIIKVGNARMVAGIAGDNYGTIENCWVSGHVESNHYSSYAASLGGIAGYNEKGATIKYCCMTGDVKNTDKNNGVGGIAGCNDGTIQHVTFTGSVSVDHKQDNKWVGEQDGTLENNYDKFNQAEYIDASAYSMYRRGITSSFARNWPTQGAGTEGAPYLISNTTDWDNFAHNVSNGIPYRGSFVKLNSDISVTTMVGSSDDYSFQGTFDGNGKTLTFNKGTAESPFNEDYCAPFRHVKNATIKNLHVAGTIYTSVMKAAGFVGESHGALTITGSVSSIAINSSKSGDGTHGGFVATLSGASNTITIEGCVFDGSFATTNGTTNCGGFVGWGVYNKPTIKNSLMKPGSVSANMLGRTFARWYTGYQPTITHCYYVETANLPTDQGTAAAAITNYVTSLGSQQQNYGLVTVYEHGIAFDGKYCRDISGLSLSGTGTSNDPYIINNADEWDLFTQKVSLGDTFSGKYVKLTDAISVTSMVGTSEANSFQGTFLGGGNAIIANITDNSSQGAALFRYISGATIKNLSVSGTVKSSQYHAAGLVGFAKGTGNVIENCVVKASVSGSGYVGGIVGHATNSNISISGSVYSGLMTGGGNAQGTLIGWGDSGTRTLTDCLYVMADGQSTSNLDLVKGNGTPTVERCYKTTADGSLGTLVLGFDEEPSTLGNILKAYGSLTAYEHGVLYGGTYYAPPFSGTGTESDPYIINNTADWETFANYVKSGSTYSDKFYKLTQDINVSTMVGTDDANSFQGIFDGDGHTLTFNKGTAESPFAEQYCAPFRHVKDAEIRKLHVAGTIYTSAKFAGGIVAETHGFLILGGCVSSVTINSSVNGDGTHGGLVASLGEHATIDVCVFDGSFATTNGTTNCGGFIGWPYTNEVLIRSSLMKPGSVAAGMLDNTFTRWYNIKPTIEDCFYVATDNLPTDQGTRAYATNAAPKNLGRVKDQYGLLKRYENGFFYDDTYYVASAAVTLADDSDNNAEAISNADGYMADVTLSGRTLYRDGKWNTLCLPFSVTLSGSPLDGATARPLTEASISGSTLNLTFGDAVTKLQAGVPYIIKWESGTDITSPVFSGVVIDKADHGYDNEASGDERVRFLGTYDAKSFTAADENSILLMGANNTLRYAGEGASLGACRAYFKIGVDGASQTRSITSFSIDFGDGEGETTGIVTVSKESEGKGASEGWYTLDGRRLPAKPTRAGVYINNGNKVVVK